MFFFNNTSNKPKHAVLIGVNYYNYEDSRLNGCINDIVNVKEMLTRQFDYQEENCVMLRDDVNNLAKRPTGMNIVNALHSAVLNSHEYSEIWIHYSGHGASIRDKDGDECDGKDEIILPCDFKTCGVISDDLIYKILSMARCPVFIVMDCCHSGSSCDLPYSFFPDVQNKQCLVRTCDNKHKLYNKNIYMLSGCTDKQTSADAYNAYQKQYGGAFTTALLSIMKYNNYSVHLIDLYCEILSFLKRSGFSQQTTLSSSNSNPNIYICPKRMKQKKKNKYNMKIKDKDIY